MKKLFAIFLVVVLCVCSAACGTAPQKSTATKSPQPAPTIPAATQATPQKIQLTAANASEYFIFSCKTADVKVQDEPMDNERGKGSVTLSISPKKRGDFDGVKLTLNLKAVGAGWADTKMTVEVPFDGKAEATQTIYSFITDYVSTTPSFKVTVDSVTGYFIEQ